MKKYIMLILLWAVPVSAGEAPTANALWDAIESLEEGWGENCDRMYADFLKRQAYGAYGFQCSGSTSSSMMSNEDSQTYERDKIFQEKYEKRIAELEKKVEDCNCSPLQVVDGIWFLPNPTADDVKQD